MVTESQAHQIAILKGLEAHKRLAPQIRGVDGPDVAGGREGAGGDEGKSHGAEMRTELDSRPSKWLRKRLNFHRYLHHGTEKPLHPVKCQGSALLTDPQW